ncbi:hypothetical protein HYQ46_008705 [Verticillium longisporum]|nr:hypothetical protein HYQ46_008705 [Verticillium longisporum]
MESNYVPRFAPGLLLSDPVPVPVPTPVPPPLERTERFSLQVLLNRCRGRYHRFILCMDVDSEPLEEDELSDSSESDCSSVAEASSLP